jgi:hypothetical protein
MSDAAPGLEALRGLHTSEGAFAADPLIPLAFLAGLLLAAGAAMAPRLAFFRHYTRRREALAAIIAADGLPSGERLAAQAAILRSLARAADPGTAHLQGKAWLAALDRMCRTTYFTDGAGHCFATELYTGGPADAGVTAQLRILIRRWRG